MPVTLHCTNSLFVRLGICLVLTVTTVVARDANEAVCGVSRVWHESEILSQAVDYVLVRLV
jgi:hypothetical protein